MQRTVSEPGQLGTLSGLSTGGRLSRDDLVAGSPPKPATPPAPVAPCQICERRLPKLTCQDCSREKLYPMRYEMVSVTLEKEALERDIENGVSTSTPYGHRCSSGREKQELEYEISGIQDRVSELRTELEAHRKYLSSLKSENERRQKLVRESRNVTAQNRDSTVEKTKKEVKLTMAKWNALYERTSDSRVFLCREVAGLNLLRQRRRRKAVEYMLNGVVIPDIRHLYNTNPSNITVALGHLSHVSVLVASYLGLKLPCEIVLPTRDAPAATIRNLRFSRPRPLSTLLPLPQLHSQDSSQYAMFIEGVSMLVYNVAWLCWSQGLEEAASEIEDVWQPGRNLYRLLLCTPTKFHQALVQWTESPSNTPDATGAMPSPSNGSPATNGGVLASSPPSKKSSQPVNMYLGRINHQCALRSLTSAHGLAHMARWKISLNGVIDRTKQLLVSETANAEWDMIENEIDEDPASKFISELGEFREDDMRTTGNGNGATRDGPGSPGPVKAIPISVKKAANGVMAGIVGLGSPGRESPAQRRSSVNKDNDVSSGWTKVKQR